MLQPTPDEAAAALSFADDAVRAEAAAVDEMARTPPALCTRYAWPPHSAGTRYHM